MKNREWANRIVRPARIIKTKATAVLVPIVQINDEAQLVFEVRSSDLDWQPGDICFPGGSIEISDRSPERAAVRETEEELGVREDQIHILGPLDYLDSPVGVTVWPFAGCLDTVAFSYNEAEVKEIFTVPVSWFLRHQPETAEIEVATRPATTFPRDVMSVTPSWKQRSKYDVYIYRFQNKIIWGITAYIVKNFIDEYRRIENLY